MNSVLDLKKRRLQRDREQQKVHDHVSAKHRVEQFDPNLFWKSVAAWWLVVAVVIFVIGAGLWIVDAYACMEEQPIVNIRTVPRI